MHLPELGIATATSALAAYLLAPLAGLTPLEAMGVSLMLTSLICYMGSLVK